MTQLQELRKEAKERGLKGYSTLCIDDLRLLIAGKPVPKKLRKNQVSIGTQTDFRPCQKCGLEQLVTHLCFKADAMQRKVVKDGDLQFDAKTGEILGCEVE